MRQEMNVMFHMRGLKGKVRQKYMYYLKTASLELLKHQPFSVTSSVPDCFYLSVVSLETCGVRHKTIDKLLLEYQ